MFTTIISVKNLYFEHIESLNPNNELNTKLTTEANIASEVASIISLNLRPNDGKCARFNSICALLYHYSLEGGLFWEDRVRNILRNINSMNNYIVMQNVIHYIKVCTNDYHYIDKKTYKEELTKKIVNDSILVANIMIKSHNSKYPKVELKNALKCSLFETEGAIQYIKDHISMIEALETIAIEIV